MEMAMIIKHPGNYYQRVTGNQNHMDAASFYTEGCPILSGPVDIVKSQCAAMGINYDACHMHMPGFDDNNVISER